jgi:hypothetical protein
VQDLRDADGDDGRPQRLESVAELANALAARAAAPSDVDGRADLEHVTTVERPGPLDADDGAREGLDHLGHAIDLGLAGIGTGAREDGNPALHDHGVLDEDGIGALVGGWDHDEVPPVVDHRLDVGIPLPHGEVDVDRHPVHVGHDPVSKGGPRPADQCGDRGGGPSSRDAAHPSGLRPGVRCRQPTRTTDDEQVSREIDELQRDVDRDDPSLVQRMRGPHRTGTTIYVLTVTLLLAAGTS